jgi:oligopeptide/dipeptide ABC transporter ATP-binding protein
MCDSPSAVICEPAIEERWKQHEASVDAEERNRGKIVEVADSLERCDKPLHPYTKALFAASLPSHPDDEREEIVLSGEVPSALNPPPGCRFHPRCPFAMARCSGHEPKLVEVSPGTREPTISTSLSTAGQVYEIAIDTADRPR